LGSLTAVSCATTASCVAVGSYPNGSLSYVTLAEVRDGKTWKIQPTPNPSGAHDSYLNGVSCTSARACVAVGDDDSSSGVAVTLAEGWNGTSWRIQKTAQLPRGSALAGVSCVSAKFCVAVGYLTTSLGIQIPLAEEWNGTTWRIQSTPSPGGARASALNGVSCRSLATCTAVGQTTNSTGAVDPLAEVWTGTAWQIQKTPTATKAWLQQVSAGRPRDVTRPAYDLSAVSCGATRSCTAVGVATTSTGSEVTFVEALRSGNWTVQATPDPTGARLSTLTAVSCRSAVSCVAVGFAEGDPDRPLVLGEVYNNKSWTIQRTSSPAKAIASALAAVSCTSATACTTVGEFANSKGNVVGLAEVRIRTAWAVQALPNASGALDSELNAVSCSSSTACTAVGYSDNSLQSSSVTLAEAWNGATWSTQPTPNPAGSSDVVLSAVSCRSASACTAVGSYTSIKFGSQFPLAESWNGSGWSITPTPTLRGAEGPVLGRLTGVSCSSSTACVAVGDFKSNDGPKLFDEAWNGSSWTANLLPTPTGVIET
jgi:hypothetical protein